MSDGAVLCAYGMQDSFVLLAFVLVSGALGFIAGWWGRRA